MTSPAQLDIRELRGLEELALTPSDRFEADWAPASRRVEARLRGQVGEAWPDGTDDARTVGIPADHAAMPRDDPARALERRRRARQVFTGLLRGGYRLADVDLARRQYLFRRDLFRRGNSC